MAHRNFSMIDYFNKAAEGCQPQFGFKGKTKVEWQAWNKKAGEKFFELLGEFPKPVPLKPEVIFSIEENGIIRERVIFDSEKDMSVPCVVLRPKEMAPDKKGRAIICSHGHGQFGKESVAGNATTPERAEEIRKFNYNYGEQMARRGFLTICPDLRGFGERADTKEYGCREQCNVDFLKGMIMGVYTMTLNIWDIKCCVEYLSKRREVNPERIGMMGLSQGGAMTTFAAAAEPRIKAADIICYLTPYEGFGINRSGICGAQVVPHIYRYFDIPEIAGLIAPRPLLIELGVHDACFLIEDALRGCRALERIYRAAGAKDKLWTDIHPGEHAFAGNKAFDFFDKYL